MQKSEIINNSSLKAFTVRDQKAGTYNPPFFKKTHGEAIRDFHTVCNDPQSLINKFPEDFDLYQVGEYDQSLGILIPFDTPQHIEKAISMTRPT